MCILTTTHYACTCTSRTVESCGADSFACEHTFNNRNLYYSCPDCELELYPTIKSFATRVMPPKAAPPARYQKRKSRPAIQGENEADKPRPQSPGAIAQPPPPFWDRDWPLGTLTQGSFFPSLGWGNIERTRQRREQAEIQNNTQDGVIVPSHKDAHPPPPVEVAPSLIDKKSVSPQPSRNYHLSIPTPRDAESVTLSPPSAFADISQASNSMKRKPSSEYNPYADLDVLSRPNSPFLPPLVITPPSLLSNPVAENSSPLTPIGPTPRTPHAFADLVAQERAQKAESRKRERVSVPHSPHNDDPSSNSPFCWHDLPPPGASPTKACKRHEGSRVDGRGNRNCDACRKATSDLVVHHPKAEELEEDETRSDMKKKAGWRGWIPVVEIPRGEFERLPKFGRRSVPIPDSTDAPITRSKPRQTRSQAKKQRRS